MKRRGFTPIELLVVIAIIAILAAILFPVFARARENARRTACASNLKQLGLGLLQYTQDFDEYMPLTQYNTLGEDGATNFSVSWRYCIYPYVKSVEAFRCPSNPERNQDANTDGFSPVALPGYPTFKNSYAVNGLSGASGHTAVFGNTTPPNNYPARKISAFEAPGVLLFVSESLRNHPYLRIDQNPAPGSSTSQQMYGGHLSTANMLFGDGHVKAMRWSGTCKSPYTWQATNAACPASIPPRLDALDGIYG